MSPITHFLASWTLLERTQLTRRDGALVALVGMAPDLDGLGIVVDFATRTLGLPETDYYQEFHRRYGHGLPAAIFFSCVVAAFADNRWRAATGAFISVHLHFLGDVLGSRGTTIHDNWPITYFAPFSDEFVIRWSGQWPLVGWQNTLITFAFIVATMALAVRYGYSPVRLFSTKADVIFVATLRQRVRRLR